jgi:hypothetical protein
MSINLEELKSKIFELLKRDEEFRYAVAGLIGMDRVLDELRKLREDFINYMRKILNMIEDLKIWVKDLTV